MSENEKIIAESVHSLKMEGLEVSDYQKELCKKLLNDEINYDEYLKLVMAEIGVA